MVLVLLYAFWLPRKVAEAERRFHRDALRLLATQDLGGLDALSQRQWLIRRFGRRHVIPNNLALAASAAGNHDAARKLYQQALLHAPPEDRVMIEVNLAGEELAAGNLDAAEGRYRTVLRARPDMPLALANLGRVLVRKGEDLEEAIGLLRQALELSDAKEAALLRVVLAEALLRARQDGWREELEKSRRAGGDAEAIARVEAMAEATG